MSKLPLIALFQFALLCNIATSQTLNDRQLTAEIDKLLSSQFKVNEPGAEILIARKGQKIAALFIGKPYSGQTITHNPANILTKDSLKSSVDGTTQTIYYYKSTAKKNMPLVVQLHSWSYPADSLKTVGLDIETISKNYNYLFPDFRGVNNHIKACCSNYVISDLDEAIDWALKNMNVDRKQIYIVGFSGGGYATLAMYMKSRHKIKAFSAWVPIADLERWYGESVDRKNKYSAEIIKCTTETESFDAMKARDRSPQFWETPVKKRRKSTIQIFAGIQDGHTGPVPISQSVNFYNKLLSNHGIADSLLYVSPMDLDYMLKQQTFNVSNDLKIGDRIIYYERRSRRIMLTIFEGGHEMLSKEVFEYLNK